MSGLPIRALLVDDDEDDYVMTRDMLAEIDQSSFTLDWAPTYEEALEAIARGEHQVYLLDYRLGERSGLDLLRQTIVESRAPMILLTGQSDHAVDVEAMKAGAADYLIKGQIGPSLLARSLRYAVERWQASHALRESEERYHRLVEISPDAIILHADERIIFANSAAARLLGAQAAGELIRRSVIDFVQADSRAHSRGRILQTVDDDLGLPFIEEKFVRVDGREVDVEVAAVPFMHQEKLAVQIIARDISARKEVEKKLIHDAFHDSLTGLANRALFIESLKHAVELAKRSHRHEFAVLFLDLDRFKNVNDSLGHTIGDQLLCALARRLERSLRDCDLVARFGGDEFAILLDGIEQSSDAIRVAERLQKDLEQPFSLGGFDVFTSASIGIAPSGIGYAHPEEVVRDADTAMYRAKALGKARHEVFDREMHARAVALLRLETDLRRAVERGEFRVVYQPIVSIESNRIYGFEALVRWQHPERGLISPEHFVQVAEETGLIIAIDSWVMEEACRQVREWQTLVRDGEPLILSVNLSGKHFTRPNLVEDIERILRATRFDRSQLHLEIKESAVMQHLAAATSMLVRMCDLGIRISMDDFGTGYSSLSCLHRFPIHTLKIDRSFIGESGASEEREIVRTIIMLAKSLKMKVVAEGVETIRQLEYLKRLKCDYGQGYYFSPPLEAERVGKWLQREAHAVI